MARWRDRPSVAHLRVCNFATVLKHLLLLLLLAREDIDVVDGLIYGAYLTLVCVDNVASLTAAFVVLLTSLLASCQGRWRRWQVLLKNNLLKLVLPLDHHVFKLLHL